MPTYPLSNRAAGYVVPSSDWNDVIDAINDLNTRVNLTPQLVQETIAPGSSGSAAQDPDTTVLLINPSGAVDVYGAVVPTRAPWQMVIINISTNNVTLKHESGSEGTPAKRFRLPGDTDLVLGLGQGVTLEYISVPVGARWVAVVSA